MCIHFLYSWNWLKFLGFLGTGYKIKLYKLVSRYWFDHAIENKSSINFEQHVYNFILMYPNFVFKLNKMFLLHISWDILSLFSSSETFTYFSCNNKHIPQSHVIWFVRTTRKENCRTFLSRITFNLSLMLINDVYCI